MRTLLKKTLLPLLLLALVVGVAAGAKGTKLLDSTFASDGIGLWTKYTARSSADTNAITLASGTEVYSAIGEVTLPAAAVQTLNATEVQVLAAPAAGQYIVVDWVEVLYAYDTAAYDGVGAGENLTLRYTDETGDELIDDIAGVGLGDQSTNQTRWARGLTTLTPVAGAAVFAHLKSGEWYAAAGGGELDLRIGYRVFQAQN